MGAVSLEVQNELDVNIADQVLVEMYEDDSTAELTVELAGGEVRVTSVSDTQPIIVPDDDLLQAVGHLATVHEAAGTGLEKVFYKYVKDSEGDWKMLAKFSYAP
ncbi:hypothetical protein ACQPXH_15735 [Nocardia sp. CA-135953]|uniref:hypothetical protein n=1 Tax=Nocardia sp. CA-135953 TaxID=3239978 RepID=UPI003D9549E2